MKKTYYQIRLTQRAPLCITNGEGEISDLDLLLDSRGLPFLPGSAIAGLLRSLTDEESAKTLFGYITTVANDAEQQESRLIVSDASLPKSAEVAVTERDGVGVDETTGSAKNGAKYDFQVVETDAPYTGVLELTYQESEDETPALLRELMERVAAEGLSAGHRTSRGYGKLDAEICIKTFDLSDPEQLEAWLDFDPFREDAFDDAQKVEAAAGSASRTVYEAELALTGNFTVRVYSTEPGQADMRPLKSSKGRPVIPGTSWAGVFRHRMLELVQQFPDAFEATADDVNEWFGSSTEQKQRSKIEFAETRIEDGSELTVTRVALDRFTMAPKQSALFTSAVWTGGKGTLAVSIPKDAPDALQRLIEACLLDLHNGLLSFGGEGSVGRGTAVMTALRKDGEPLDSLLGLDWKKGGVQ